MEQQPPSTRLFISQSKERALRLAQALHTFLPMVVQGSDPWVSADGIDPGTNFRQAIDRNLTTSLAGIICVTPENQNEPWLLFEAGALTQKPHEHVWIVLLDLEPGEMPRPLGDLQLTVASDRAQMFEMIKSIDRIVSEAMRRTQREQALERLFDMFWTSDLNPLVQDLLAHPPADRPAAPTQAELMTELLQEIRERRVDSWRISKTLLLLSDLYRQLLAKAAPGISELAAAPNVSPEDGSGSVRIVVPPGRLTIGASAAPSIAASIASTQLYPGPPPALHGDSDEQK